MKQTKTKIPEGTAAVRNVVTGETKYWCSICGKFVPLRCQHLNPLSEMVSTTEEVYNDEIKST